MQSTQQLQSMKASDKNLSKAIPNPNSPDEIAVLTDPTQHVSSEEEFEQRISSLIKTAQTDADRFTANDKMFRQRETVEVVLDILNRIKSAGDELNKQSEQTRERLYYLTFNITVLIFRLCHQLRIAGYSREATQFLAFNILCLDNNLILTTAKYLDWRIMNYLELGRAYADNQSYKAAVRVISYGIQKVLYLKQIEEQDPPVPDGTKETLVEALRVLRTQELKYQLQAGVLTPEAWKKKIEETFSQNKYHRSLAIVECLSTNDPACSRQIQRSAKNLAVKTQALKLSIDFVRADIELVKQALIQIHEKKKRDREKKDTLLNRGEADLNVDELLEKYKALDNEMIKEKDWKFASNNVPIEVHVEILKLCYECKLMIEFDLLLDPALVRLKFRRYEVPYLATVDVLMSANKTANIPNGFEKIPKDLNAANLRIELKKLRAQAKLAAGIAPKKEEKKEEGKKGAPEKDAGKGKPDPKAAAGKKPDPKAKGQPEVPQEIPKDEEDENQIAASEEELDKIKHIYVNLLLQRTKNAQNAVVGIDVVLADEHNGPDLPENHYAVAVPIRQHQGVYEKTKLIPYIVFKRTANALIDEEDSLSLITDVTIIMGQDPHLRAPLGYHKIPIDLRQTPRDLERVPNLDYVFVCYKTDKHLALTERDLLIFRRLADLEKSFKDKAEIKNNPTFDEAKQFLSLSYNLDMLVDLSRTIKEALLGPLGDHFLENRQDILFDIACLLWSKYLLPVMQRIDVYLEMRHQREYPNEFILLMDEQIIQLKHQLVEPFNTIHRILTRIPYVADIILYSKFSIHLANIQEELGEFRNAVQTLRSAVGKIIEWREDRLKMSLDSKENVRTSMSITIDNKRIGDLEEKIQTVYDSWEQLILRKERDRERRAREEPALEEDEGDEEQIEVQKCIEELKNKDLFERNISVEEWRKTMRAKEKLSGIKYFNEQEQLVHSLHADILLNLYRCEIKLGTEMGVVKSQTNKLLISQGIDLTKNAPNNLTKNLSASLSQKMNQAKSKTLAKSKNDLQTLKQTLQEAGKLPPPKPETKPFEKILERENNQNPYQNALLYMSLAASNTNIVEQKSLLLEAFEFLKKARHSEDSLATLALENAVHIKAATHYHEYFKRTANDVHPFELMGRTQYIKKSVVPQKPVMICRTSTSIVMKLPFFRPETEYKSWRNIAQMALYGKPSGSGVGVSLNNTEYEGTGEKRNAGDIVKVTGLIPNEKYVFAAAGYTADDICVNGIGETSTEIPTLLPLSLHQLYGYLAEFSFKLGHYQIAKQAAEWLCSLFIEKNEFKYSFLDTRINPILAFKLNQEYISLVSPIEAKQISEAFLILAKVSKLVRSDIQRRADSHELKVEKQKIDMKIANYQLIALDIATQINNGILIKRVVSDLFNHLVPYMQMNFRPHLLFQALFKCHQSIRLIPQELIDANMRRVIGCLTYQILKLGFEYAEDDSVKRVMISEIPINTRKWRKFQQYVMRRPQLTEEQKAKKIEQEKRMALGEKIPESELIKDPEPYEEKIFKVDEFEVEGASLEEFLLSLIDYQDVVKAKTERWKLQINRYQKVIGHEGVEKMKEKILSQVVEFWEGIRLQNPSVYLQQILASQTPESNQRYLEFCCKCIRRSMELNLQTFTELEDILNNKVKLQDEVMGVIENKIAERLEYLDKDIVRQQRRRFNLLEEKVAQLQEQKTLTGGNKAVNVQKLLEQLDQAGEHIDANDNYWGIVQFEPDQIDEERMTTYNFLWLSERFLIQGMCQFLGLQQIQPIARSQLQVTQSCVFNDILQLDFNKYKQALDEVNDRQRRARELFEEEHKNDNQQFTLTIDDRVKRMTAFLKVMARAAEYARNARAWLQLENIIRYTWNAFSYDLTSPLELKDTDAWKYVVTLSECSLYLMEYLKNGGTLRKATTAQAAEIDEVRNQKPTLYKEPGKTVAFNMVETQPLREQANNLDESKHTMTTARSGAGGAGGKGLKWYEKLASEGFDISIHASFITFGIQCLMGVKRCESLVDASNRLNTVSENTYASLLLPFIIYAQTTLYEEAAYKTTLKRNELQLRIQQFENWKLTNKKKRSRQAMITGEIPLEEQEFLKDKALIEKEIFRLEIIESVLHSDKQKSEILLENIKRDANNCEESLKQCRKLYFQFGVETQSLRLEELRRGTSHFEIKAKKKGHKVYTSMVISNYKKCIELLRKRQEKFLLIQALHELGNLLYADGQLGEAEIQWNDCVDTIFQKLYVVNSFRQVFKENPQLADAFGSKQCLIGGIVLTKLSKLCYEGRDQFRYNECLLMAADLFAAPARLSLPHPQVASEYANYKIREFISDQLYIDKYVLSPSEILHTIATAAQSLIDCDLFEKALPLTSLMEYVATDIVKSKVLTVKARIMKAQALIEIGYINEAYQIYNRILSQKDLPKNNVRESEFMSKKDGKNFYFPLNQKYNNHLPPESDKNNEAIQNILKPIQADVLTQMKKYCSPFVIESLQYLRCLFLIRLGESENVEAPEKADFRNNLLKTGEDQLRSILRSAQFNEEVLYLQNKLDQLMPKEVEIPTQEISDYKIRLQKVFENFPWGTGSNPPLANGQPQVPNLQPVAISEEEQKTYYANREEEMCYADRRSQFMSLMLRARMLIARSQQKQGMLLNAFYILRQGLTNFKTLAEGKHGRVEFGVESEDKGSFKLPEIYGGTLAAVDPKAKPGQAQAKKEEAPPSKKPAAGGKASALQQQQDEEEAKRQEEARKKREADEEANERMRTDQSEKREHPHIFLWLKIKLELITIQFNQKRYEDCADTIAITRLECTTLNDQFFIRQLMQIECLMDIYRGELEQAQRTADKVRKHAQAYNQNDIDYAWFLGNISEFIYNRDRSSEANDYVKEGRLIVWYKLRDYGLDIDPQNINETLKYALKVNKARNKPTEDILTPFQTAIPQPGAKGAAAQKPPAQKPAGKPGQPVIPDDLPVEEEKEVAPLDFTQNIEYQLVPFDANINSSYSEPNIYLRYLESAIRFDVRYAQYLTILDKKHELAKKVLSDSEKLLKRTLHCSPQLKFYVNYLLGHSNLQIFYEKVQEFQSKYAEKPKYKESLTRHIPYGGLALGKFLQELPNFTQQMQTYFRDYLEWARKSLKQAIDLAKTESIIYEFDFSLVDALRELSETNFLLAEYRARILTYKYARYTDLDIARKVARKIQSKKDDPSFNPSLIDDNLLEEEMEKEVTNSKDEWEEQKINRERLEIANYKRHAVHYMEACITVSKAQREFVDRLHLMGSVNLTDPSKVPREVAWELFESASVTKVNYVKIPDFDPKDKTAITSSELLNYLKSLTKELEFVTFGDEKQRQSKLISKIHRYLRLNLASYVQKCVIDVKEPDEIKDANTCESIEHLAKSRFVGKWSDLKKQKSALFYIIGPIDEALLNSIHPLPAAGSNPDLTRSRAIEEVRKDHQMIHFGKLEVDPLALSALYQEVRDLIDKMKASEKLSAAQNERDRKGYRVRFDQLLERFGNFFKAPIVSEEQTDDIDCLELIKDVLPDLSVDNVEKLAQILQKESGFGIQDAKFGTILRRFHRIRYVK